MKSIAVLAAVLLTQGAALAKPPASSAPPLGPRSASPIFAPAAASEPLFFALDSDTRMGGIERVQLAVKVAGRPYLRETLLVPPGTPKGTVIQFLATAPQVLERLYEIASGDAKGMVTASILAGEREQQTFSFADFVSLSRELKAHASHPLRLKGNLELLNPAATAPARRQPALVAKGWVLIGSCSNSCQQQYDACQAAGCGYQDLCDSCSNDYSACINGCWECQPDVSYSDEGAVTGDGQVIGEECLQDQWFAVVLLNIEVSHVKHTDYCGLSHQDDTVYTYETHITCDSGIGSPGACPGGIPTSCP